MYIKDDEINRIFNEKNWKTAHNYYKDNTITNMHPAFCASPRPDKILLFCNRFHLLCQFRNNFFWYTHFERTFQSVILDCLIQTLHLFAQICSAAVFATCRVNTKGIVLHFQNTDHFSFFPHFVTSHTHAHRTFLIHSLHPHLRFPEY